jgi:hypothetical protein
VEERSGHTRDAGSGPHPTMHAPPTEVRHAGGWGHYPLQHTSPQRSERSRGKEAIDDARSQTQDFRQSSRRMLLPRPTAPGSSFQMAKRPD